MIKIENDIVVAEDISLNHGVFVPRSIQPGIPLYLVKHIDFKNDTPGEKSELHGTTLVVFQKNSKLNHGLLKIRRTKCFTFQHIPFQENVKMRPNPPNETFSGYEAPSSSVDVSSYRNADRIWGLCQVCQVIDEKRLCQLPTWRNFNSLLSDTPTVTVSQGLLLYPGSPTDWGNLYTAVKLV